MSRSNLANTASMSTASSLGRAVGLSGFSLGCGSFQQQLVRAPRHLTRFHMKRHANTTKMAKIKLGIPRMYGWRVPNKPCFWPLVLASTESSLMREGPKSVIETYCPSLSPFALLATWLATSAPAPNRRPVPSHLPPPFRMEVITFLFDLVFDNFGAFHLGRILMLSGGASVCLLKSPQVFQFEALETLLVHKR